MSMVWFIISWIKWSTCVLTCWYWVTKAASLSEVNRGKWLWNPTSLSVVGFCSLFWPCTKYNSCLLRTEELNNNNVLVTQFTQCMSTKQEITHGPGPSNIVLKSLPVFAPLMFSLLHNHFPLLIMVVVIILVLLNDKILYAISMLVVVLMSLWFPPCHCLFANYN